MVEKTVTLDRQPGTRRRVECLAIVLVITFASLAIPVWVSSLSWSWFSGLFADEYGYLRNHELYANYVDILALLVGLVLVLPAPQRYGLRIGNIREHWWRVLVVCGVPLMIAWIGALVVPIPAWMGQRIGVWLISPLAQDLVFAGFLFTIIHEAFPGYLHRRIPVLRALPITATFFALWHVPNFLVTDTWFVCLQLVYTFCAFVFVGLSRQWTGSIIYATVAHSIANFIGWWYAPSTPTPEIILWPK